MKYHIIHHGTHHTFDVYDTPEKNPGWIFYECDGDRHGAQRGLLSESFEGACIKYVDHCLERIQANEAAIKVHLHHAGQQADNITVWSNNLVRFAHTLIKQQKT